MVNFFFDIDGVIIPSSNTNPIFSRQWDQTLNDKTNIDPMMLEQDFFKPYFKDILLGKRPLYKTLKSVLNARGIVHIDPEIILNIWFNAESTLDTGIVKLLFELQTHQNIDLYIASNQSLERTDFLWEKMQLKQYFKGFYISSLLNSLKSEVIFFQKINNEIKDGIKVLIDDDYGNIVTCQKCGWLGIHYQSLPQLLEDPLIKKYLSST